MTSTRPEPPPGYVFLSDVMLEADPEGRLSDVLCRRIEKLIEHKHPLIAMDALVVTLIRHLERAPEELRNMLGSQISYQLTEYFKQYLQ